MNQIWRLLLLWSRNIQLGFRNDKSGHFRILKVTFFMRFFVFELILHIQIPVNKILSLFTIVFFFSFFLSYFTWGFIQM